MGGHCGNLKCYCHSESSWIILASYAHLCTDAKLSVDCQRCTLLRPCESQTNAFQPSFIRWAWDRHWQTHKNRTHTYILSHTACLLSLHGFHQLFDPRCPIIVRWSASEARTRLWLLHFLLAGAPARERQSEGQRATMEVYRLYGYLWLLCVPTNKIS